MRKHFGSPSQVNSVWARQSEHVRVLFARAMGQLFFINKRSQKMTRVGGWLFPGQDNFSLSLVSKKVKWAYICSGVTHPLSIRLTNRFIFCDIWLVIQVQLTSIATLTCEESIIYHKNSRTNLHDVRLKFNFSGKKRIHQNVLTKKTSLKITRESNVLFCIGQGELLK